MLMFNVIFSIPFPFLCFPFRGVSKLMKLIDKGVLPQDAKPPENILLQPPLDYLDWISNLPRHLQDQVVHFSPSCSIKEQKEKVCLCGQEGASHRPQRTLGNVFPRSLWATSASSEGSNSDRHVSITISYVPGPLLSYLLQFSLQL